MTAAGEEAGRLLHIARSDRDAFLLLAAAPGIRSAIAMFLAQQSVEKAMKASMFALGLPVLRTHDLAELAVSLSKAIALPFRPEELARLSPYAVEFRYDDTDIELVTREQASQMVDGILIWAEGVLGVVGSGAGGAAA